MSVEYNNIPGEELKVKEVIEVSGDAKERIDSVLYCDEILKIFDDETKNNTVKVTEIVNSLLTSGKKFVQLDNTNLEDIDNLEQYNNDIGKIRDFINFANKLDVGQKEQVITALAVNLGLGYNTLLAMAYTEEPTEIIIRSQATEKPMERGDVYINLSNESIEGGRSSYTEYYIQEGNVSIDREIISGAVLDFTGSMKKDQLEGMLMAIQELAQSGTIDANTSFNIMYKVPDMQGDAFNRSTIGETQQLTQNIQYGQNGKGLEAALLNLGLIRITNGERHIVDGIDGKGSTPLYDTILKNLMNSNVRNCVVFTDGSSDTANIGTGEEELGNTESWDQMIRLCRDYNKTIKIIVFNNSNSVYRNRIQEMEKYFEAHGGLNYLSFGKQKQNDGQILGGQDLSNWLQNSLTNTMDNTTIRISEDENVALHQINAQYVNDGTSTTISQKPEGFPKNFDGTIVFDGEGYNINLQEIFGNIDFSKYDLYYEIFSENGIKGAYQFNNVLNENDMTLFDLTQASTGYINSVRQSQYRNSYFFQKNDGNHEIKTINEIVDINKIQASNLVSIINALASTNEYPLSDGCVLNLFSSCSLINFGGITESQTSQNLRKLLCDKHLTLNIYDYSHDRNNQRGYGDELTALIMRDVENIITDTEKHQLFEGMLDNNGNLKSFNCLDKEFSEHSEIFEGTLAKEYKDKNMFSYFYSFVKRIYLGTNSSVTFSYTSPGYDVGNDINFKKDFVENHIYNGTNGRGKINIYAAEIDEQGRIGERGEAFGLPTGYTRTAMSLRLTPKEGVGKPITKILKIEDQSTN